MNAVHFNAVKSAIQSLIDSTFVRVESSNLCATITGRASPYISHRAVEFANGGHDFEYMVMISNYVHIICVGHSYPEPDLAAYSEKYECDVVTDYIPTVLLEELTRSLRQAYGLEIINRQSALTRVTWLVRRIQGFDEDGRPIFIEKTSLATADAAESAADEYLGSAG